MRVRILAVLFAAFLILAGSAISSAQTVQGVILGTVTDPSGAVVPNAAVTITNPATNFSEATTTGSDGTYRFSLVPPGTYTIDIKAANFGEVRASGVVVEASQTVPFSVKLELAKASQVIEVTSQAPLVQTATSDLGFQVDSKTIENAALVDRDIFGTLPFMAAGVSPGIDGVAASGGARESGTSFMLNGAEDNNNFSEGAMNTNPPLESVEDFSVITNSMSAQYGRGSGAVVSANQKSGTNQVHGVLYEQNRNATLNANDFFYNRDLGNSGGTLPDRPKYIKNQFGGTVGGPIRKDKTFFFVAVDRFKLIQGSTKANNFVPTSAALSYVVANGGPVAQEVLKQYTPVTSDTPCPGQKPGTTGAGTTNGLPNAVGCLSFSDPVTTTQNVYYGRVDHNFSQSDRLSFSANITRFLANDEFGGGSILTSGPISALTTLNAHNLALVETHTFSPRLFNEVNLSHNRFFNPFVEGNPSTQSAPEVIIDNRNVGGLCYEFGPIEGGQIQSFVQDRWGLQDNLTYTVGRHAIRIGASGSYGILYRNWDLGKPGYYEFGNLSSLSDGANSTCAAGSLITPTCDGTLQSNGTINNVARPPNNSNFTGDYPYFQEVSINPSTGTVADAYRHYTYHDYAGFIQDDWKIRPRLTLNLGLRWERFGAPSEANGILAQFTNLSGCNLTADLPPAAGSTLPATNTCVANARTGPVSRMWNTRNGDLGPRVGFAYDIFGNGKTALRGSYGIYYDRIFDNIWSNGAWNPPFYALIDIDATSGDAVNYSSPSTVGGATLNVPRVSVRTMDINMKDASSQNFYLGLEHQFFGGLLMRASYQGSLGRHLPMLQNYNRQDGIGYDPTFAIHRPNPKYSGFNYRSDSVSSNYNSLVVEVQKHLGHGLEFQTAYSWSKLLDVNSELFAGCSTIGGLTAPYYYMSNAFPRLNYGRGAEDHKQAFKFNATYEIPFLKSEKGFAGHLLGGWSVGTFFQFYGGHPIDVVDGRSSYPADAVDANGIPINIGGDYNLDNVLNDHPVFLGSSINSVYSGASPADGIFKDNNIIGCAAPWQTGGYAVSAANINACNAAVGVAGASFGVSGVPDSPGTPSTLFASPGYPTTGQLYQRFGTLGRDVFHGPKFMGQDLGLKKTFKLTERMNLRFSADAQNLWNHANFDCIDSNLSSGTFGQAQCLVGSALSRIMSLSLRLAF